MRNMHYNEYWSEVQAIFAFGDVLTIVEGAGDWEGDEVIEYRNSCRCLLSRFNIDRDLAEYF